LYISTEIEATGSVPVPICFGYRIYLRREHARGDVTIVRPARRRVVIDERLLPTGAIETLEMSAATLGADELREVLVFEADRRLTVASDTRRLTVESLTGFPLAQVRTVASEPYVVVEALTAAPDALSRDLFRSQRPGDRTGLVGDWTSVGEDLRMHTLTPSGLLGRITSATTPPLPYTNVIYLDFRDLRRPSALTVSGVV
jgi:hypothetical protein